MNRKIKPGYLALFATTAIAGAAGWGLSTVDATNLSLMPAQTVLEPVQKASIQPIKMQSRTGSVADIVQAVQPAVVSITVEQKKQNSGFGFTGGSGSLEDMMRQFMGRGRDRQPIPREKSRALGSGFLISNDGYILTNNHVVENGDRFLIEFSDRSVVEASLVGGDAETDIAVLKVSRKPSVTPLSLADSNDLRIGETVIAIGNPYGVGQTVTTGIVSAKGRSLGNSNYVDYIQTDAPINQGNSGGPLLNDAGQVIGINTAIYSPSGGSVGIGFAVPSNTVKRIVGQLKKDGRVTRGYLGIGIQDVTPAIASSMDLAKAEGAIVTTVSKDSPAFGKLKTGDVVTKFDSIPIRTARDLSKAAAFAKIGASTELSVIRDGTNMDVSLAPRKLATKSGDPVSVDDAENLGKTPKLGVTVAPLDDARSGLNGNSDQSGVLVTGVENDGPAERGGIRAGDIIERFNRTIVSSPQDLVTALKKSGKKIVPVLVNRRGAKQFITVELG